MNTNLPFKHTRLIALACSLLALAAACDPGDRDTHEQASWSLDYSSPSYAQRCQHALGGAVITTTYGGHTQVYCAFGLSESAEAHAGLDGVGTSGSASEQHDRAREVETVSDDGLDGVGTGGTISDAGLDGVGTGGESTCAVLTETPHMHVIEERHVGVCSSSMSLSANETHRLGTALDAVGLIERAESTDPTGLSHDGQCFKALYCGQISLGQDKESLYACEAGTYTLVQVCEQGCQENQGQVDDACHSTPLIEENVCPGGRCIECTERCVAVGERDPVVGMEAIGGVQALDLRVVDADRCGVIELEVTKANGSLMGAGDYALRVGSCRSHGVIREHIILNHETASFRVETDHSGSIGEIKEFCATKHAGPGHNDPDHEAWWWSNFVIVDRVEECH